MKKRISLLLAVAMAACICTCVYAGVYAWEAQDKIALADYWRIWDTSDYFSNDKMSVLVVPDWLFKYSQEQPPITISFYVFDIVFSRIHTYAIEDFLSNGAEAYEFVEYRGGHAIWRWDIYEQRVHDQVNETLLLATVEGNELLFCLRTGALLRGEVFVHFSRADLAALLTQARAVERGNHTDASWNALQGAITAAQAVIDDGNATQSQVNAQVAALQAAMDGLIATDKAALAALLTQARAIAKGNHTDASWNALQGAITAAQAVADDGNAAQSQVNAQVAALQAAINGLTENPPLPPWWAGLPGILQWILRWFFFGWIWM